MRNAAHPEPDTFPWVAWDIRNPERQEIVHAALRPIAKELGRKKLGGHIDNVDAWAFAEGESEASARERVLKAARAERGGA